MNYVLIGGDARMQSLYRRLKRDGESVFCYAMETAPLPDGAKCTELPKSADVYVRPLPSEKRRGHINAPFCPSPPETARLFAELPQGALVCGGKVSGIVPGRGAKKRDVGMMMTKLGGNKADE